MPPFSHLISCTPSKSISILLIPWLLLLLQVNLPYTGILTFHVQNVMFLFLCLGRTNVSIQARGKCSCFVTEPVFTVRICQHLAQFPSWRTTPCWLPATTYSVYSRLPSILEAVPPTATCGRAMPWWQTHLSRNHLGICCLSRLL